MTWRNREPALKAALFFSVGAFASGALVGALWTLVVARQAPPTWFVVALFLLAMATVFAFAAAEDLLQGARTPPSDPPEFGPARYAGPERRKGSRAPERPVLVAGSGYRPEGPARRANPPPKIM